jgi:glycosidase
MTLGFSQLLDNRRTGVIVLQNVHSPRVRGILQYGARKHLTSRNIMFTSLFSAEVKNEFDTAESKANTAGGPFPSPGDWRDQIIYFIIVDRFNNPSADPLHKPYGDASKAGEVYQGGKFKGIEQQLPYIKGLGVGAIWLSPVLKNIPVDEGSYHGYGIHNFLRANPKFCSDPNDQDKADQELRELVDAAHQNGLYVILDIVLNHTGSVFTYNGNAQVNFSPTALPVQWRDATGASVPAWVDAATIPAPQPFDADIWPSEFQDNKCFRRQGMTAGSSTIGDFQSLKQLVSENPDVRNFLIRAYQYVIARFDADGFRIDTIRYLQGDFPQVFGNAMREYALILGKRNFFTFGEIWSDNSATDIPNFIGRNTQILGDMNSPVGVDAALDYPLVWPLIAALKGFGPWSNVATIYNQRKNLDQYILSSHGDASRYFVTFIDNHDMKQRFRWEQPGNPSQYDDQVTMGVACLYCLPGVPCLYYGTEQGLHGFGSDPGVREALWGMVPGFPQTTPFYVEIQKIATARNQQPALRYGRFYFRPISGDGFHFGISSFPNGVLAWSRIINDEELLVVANSNTTQQQSPHVILDIKLSSPGQNLRILYSNKKAPTSPAAVRNIPQASVVEADGSTGNGPLNSVQVTLQPMEVQILRI